jgi:Cu/Ag efflux protein CusF
MGTGELRLAGTILVMGAVLGLTSCKKSGSGQGGSAAPAAITAVEVTATATVEAVDPANRTVTLRLADGTTHTYNLAKDVTNLNQINAGDRVKATVIESMAVYVRKAGTPPEAAERSTVTLAPKGQKPGMIAADTLEVTDKIAAIDIANRTITLQGTGGKPQTLTVGPNVNLANLKKGDDVVVRYTQGLAVLVETP